MKIEFHTLKKIREINSSYPRNEYIDAWKKEGKKVIGWHCSYVPEEILYAADILPVRMTGYHTPVNLNEATVRLSTGICTMARSVMQMALDKKIDFFDGFISANCCDHTRRLGELFVTYEFAAPYNEILNPPLKLTQEAVKLYRDELAEFKTRLEHQIGIAISDEALWDAIDLYNQTRKLVKELYDLRKSVAPLISGSEIVEVMNASFVMPKTEYNQLLTELLNELKSWQLNVEATKKPRVMLIGSPMTNSELMKEIEALGAEIVYEEACTAGRNYWEVVKTSPKLDPLDAIASRYIANSPCARMTPASNRIDRLIEAARDFKVQGVISTNVRFCTIFIYDVPIVREKMEQIGCPLLELDVEYNIGANEQIRTRVQAFLEMIKNGGK